MKVYEVWCVVWYVVWCVMVCSVVWRSCGGGVEIEKRFSEKN